MSIVATRAITCPRCKSEAIYKYGKTKSGRQRYICIICKKQFTTERKRLSLSKPTCSLCGSKMYVYMRDKERKVIRFRCSRYPICKNYMIRRMT